MQFRIVTTSTARAAERHDAWVAALEDFGIECGPPNASQGFNAELRGFMSEPLSAFFFAADNSPVRRSLRQIRRLEWGQYWLYRETGSGAWFEFNGREIRTEHGDLLFFDADAPFRTLAAHDYGHQLWTIQRALADPHLPTLQRPIAVHLSSQHPARRMIDAYLDMLAKEIGPSTAPMAAVIADHLTRLVAIACGSQSKDHRTAARMAKLEQARRYVESHLTSHALAPENAAAALGISVRQLHLCFEMDGESFGQFVRRRRLQECRATLQNPLSVGRSVADIAFSWGFASLPTFYRAFNQAFGITPSDLRQQSLETLIQRADIPQTAD